MGRKIKFLQRETATSGGCSRGVKDIVPFVVISESKTSQTDLQLWPAFSGFTPEHGVGREAHVTRVGVLKQHRIVGKQNEGTEGLYKGVTTVMDSGI